MRPAGFEPATHSLEGCCSIHLSYGRNGWKGNGWQGWWYRWSGVRGTVLGTRAGQFRYRASAQSPTTPACSMSTTSRIPSGTEWVVSKPRRVWAFAKDTR